MSLAAKRIGFIGGGSMAEALAGGLVSSGVAAERIRIADVSAERRAHCAAALGVETAERNAGAAGDADVVVIAVKPADVAAALAEAVGDPEVDAARPLWISIAAGVTLARLERLLSSDARVVRAMPNTPALVRCGATGLCGNARVGDDDLATACALFDGVGLSWVAPEEGLLDAVTGLSGSGPAYVFLLLEALVDAGAAVGLPRDAALRLARQTVLGAARLAVETGRSPAALREQVSSPGGTTVEGLRALAERGFREAVGEAVAAATRRSRELGSS